MKKITINYTHEELQLMASLTFTAHKALISSGNIPDKISGVLLGRLSIKMAKRMLYNKDKYHFNYTPEHALALYRAYEEGIIATTNKWALNLLNQTHSMLSHSLQL